VIVSVEVLEHMPPEEALKAIDNLCRFTDNIIISTSPYDYKEATHFNVHQPDYWARQFARFDFFHDVDYDASYITPWAMRFYRANGAVQPVIQAYERTIWQLQTEIKELRSSVIEHHQQLQAVEDKQKSLEDQQKLIQEQWGSIEAQKKLIQEQQGSIEAQQKYIRELQNTRSWKMVHTLQDLRARLFPVKKA
jgi:hypothetical protein